MIRAKKYLLALCLVMGLASVIAVSPAMNSYPIIPVDADSAMADSRKGFIANDGNGTMTEFNFESDTSPATVNPSLWLQSKLNNIAGLFKVSDGIYQVRGYDLANMSIIEGDNGIILIDALTTKEASKKALNLYYKYRPNKPVVAVIFTHSHVDHFGGIDGVVSATDIKSSKVKIIAPLGFSEHAISENVYVGNAMSRRGQYMYGINLPDGVTGFVDNGLGKKLSVGMVTFAQPTDIITTTGQELNIAGIKFIFQLTPGTEAPSEMNIYLPQLNAIDMAENSSKTLHNLYTLRGAEIRDSKAWAMFLEQSIDLYANKVQVMFTQHHWPTWGSQQIVAQLSNQRDQFLFIHDQSLRLANLGYTPAEIAETMQNLLPDELYKYSYERGYYGTVKHNSRAVYQKYLGFYDGNPVNLDPLPESVAAKQYVDYMGGSTAVLKKAEADYNKGNYRWVVTVVNQVLYADPTNKEAQLLQAKAFEQLGFMAEAAPWRNEYLVAAMELRNGVHQSGKTSVSPDVVVSMTIPQLFDSLAIKLNPEKAKNKSQTINWIFTDIKQSYTIILHNSVFRYKDGLAENPDFTITLDKSVLDSIIVGKTTFVKALATKEIKTVGNKNSLSAIFSCFESPESNFAIVP